MEKIKILLIGKNGQIGTAIKEKLKKKKSCLFIKKRFKFK